MSKRYDKILKQLEKKILRLVQSMLKNGAAESVIKREVKKLILEFNPYKKLSKQFESDAEKVADSAFESSKKTLFWIDKHTRPKLSKKALSTLLVVNNQFALIQNQINRKVVKAVETAIKKDLTSNELSTLISKSVNGGRYQANTIANTSLQGYSQANSLQMEIDAGIEKWKYAGPPAQRLFCQERLDKTYTKEQIERMDNKQGLSVFYFGGGFNCRHKWEAVIDDDLLKKLGVK
jgi:hypothetical protein